MMSSRYRMLVEWSPEDDMDAQRHAALVAANMAGELIVVSKHIPEHWEMLQVGTVDNQAPTPAVPEEAPWDRVEDRHSAPIFRGGII